MKIIYSDSHIVVVEKPGGLLAVPGRGVEKQDSVVMRVKRLFPGMIEQPAVHRLDMQTSGIMVLAKTAEAHRLISIQFERRTPKKTYEALLDGIVYARSGRIELKFRLDTANRPYQIFDPVNGRTGITLWRNLGVEGNTTRVEMSPLTGRTHQLRLHASHEKGLGIPIVGDYLYGRGNDGDRMMLHATRLSFAHPASGRPVTFSSPAPF